MENTIQQKIEQSFGVDLRVITEKVFFAYICMFVVFVISYFSMLSIWVGYASVFYSILFFFVLFQFISLVVLTLALVDIHKTPFSKINLPCLAISLAALLPAFEYFGLTSMWYIKIDIVLKITTVIILFMYGIHSLSSKNIIRKMIAWVIIVITLFVLIAAIVTSLGIMGKI